MRAKEKPLDRKLPPPPAGLEWFAERAAELAATAAFPWESKGDAAGETRLWAAEVPDDAPWADDPVFDGPEAGRCPCLQLDLGSLPKDVEGSWPREGVVWVFMDFSEGWGCEVRFDPRPASAIPWRRASGSAGRLSWVTAETLPRASEAAVPELAWDEADAEAFDLWGERAVRGLGDVQVGGKPRLVVFDADDLGGEAVCSMVRQEFGDCGEMVLLFSKERGFFAKASCA